MASQTTIPAGTAKTQTTVVASTTGPFAIAWPFFHFDDVVVTIETGGLLTTQVRGVDYNITATANDDGIYPSGTIDFLAPIEDCVLTRYRETSIERLSNFPLTGFLDRASLNADLNRAMASLQDILSKIDRSLRVRAADTVTLNELPIVADRVSQLIGFDANGQLAMYALDLAAPEATDSMVLSTGSSTARSLAARFAEEMNGLDFGALGNGTTFDTAGFVAALLAQYYVVGRPGLTHPVSGLAVTGSKTFDGRNALFKAAVGASKLMTLSGFSPHAERFYVSDNSASSGAAIEVNAQRFARIRDVTVVNAGAGAVRFRDVGSIGVALPNMSDVHAEQVTGNGIEIQHSVSELKAANVHIYGLVDFVSTLGRPRAGSIGWRQNTPITGGFAVGGHQVVNANMSTCEIGYHLTDAQLSLFANCVADGCRDYGLKIDGASTYIDFADFFCGTSMGIYVGGTSANINFNGLRTVLNGVVPPWGQATYYNSAGPYFDVTVADTAVVTIAGDAWRGNKRVSVASGAKLSVTGGTRFFGRTIANTAVSTDHFLNETGAQTVETIALWRAQSDGYLFMLRPVTSVAPGGSETYTYTVRVNGVDTSLVATITGAAFAARAYGPITVTEGDSISIKRRSSAGATINAREQVFLQILGL